MRTVVPVNGGGDGGESRGLRSRVGRMKKLLRLKPSHCVDVHTDTEPGVWLTRFQLLDTDGQYEDPVQEWGEEEEDGAVFGVTLRREPVPPSSDTPELPTAFGFVQYHTVKVRRLKAGTLERLVTHLLDPEHQEPDFIRVFLCTYRAFTSTSTLIALLFQRDDSVANLDHTVCPRSTLPPVVRLWLEEYGEDFHEPPQYQALRLLCVHLRRRLRFRRLAQTAERLLKRLQAPDCSQSSSQHSGEPLQQEHRDQEHRDQEHRDQEDGDQEHRDQEDRDQEDGDQEHRDQEHRDQEDGDQEHRDQEHRDQEDGDQEHRDQEDGDQEHRDQEDRDQEHRDQEHRDQEDRDQEHRDQEDSGETDAKEEEKCNFMDFAVREVAEQLTRLDAELFVRVEPFHCLGCVWSQRDKKENRNLAPTVRATISQFNAVTNRVITSLLCPPSPNPSTSSPISSPGSSSTFLYSSAAPSSPRCSRTSPGHRARVIEGWIAVAQECRQLKNFSSLRAILSALQSNSLYRLKKTWAAVSRESMNTFDHLSETFPDENCVLTSREILLEDGTPPDGSAPPGSVTRPSFSSGVVPYLGTYLTVLTMLDTALTDTVEGGLINFEKRRREFEILSQIRQLQASCSRYSLPVNPHIAAWLQAHTLLTDQESYELSRDLEPPVDPCPSSPNSWSSRLLTKKLASLRTGSYNSLRKTHADQISVSSSGSSSSELEDLSVPQPSPSPLRLKLKALSGSPHDVAEDLSSSSSCSSSPSLSSSSCSSSHPDLSSSSLVLSPESSSSGCCSQAVLPVYNKQVADSCIIRVSVESVSNGNVYKSILLTSQDHTRQVIERALEKHSMEDGSCQNFNLCQMLSNGKDLQIPDKANVFYAMCTSANYDFVLRRRWRSQGRRLGSSSSTGAQQRSAK